MIVGIQDFNENHTYTPECETEKIPFMNQSFDSINAAYVFYENYGRLCGFDVRRSSQKTNKQGIVTSKYFVCCRAGVNVYDK